MRGVWGRAWLGERREGTSEVDEKVTGDFNLNFLGPRLEFGSRSHLPWALRHGWELPL